MNLGFIPKGNYSFKELLELVVKQKFGEKTAKPITVENDIEYNSSIWSKDWQSAREIIRQALEVGTLTAWIEDSNTQEKYIPKSDWAIPKGDSFAYSHATLTYGTLQHGDRDLRGTVVYVRIKEADVFLHALTNVRIQDQFISEAAKILKKRPRLQASELIQYQNLSTLIRDSGVSINHIKKNWTPKARTLAGTKGGARKGAPKKTR